MSTLPATFWAKVTKTDTCWNWTGAIQSRGYGSFQIGDHRYSTHRLAYIDAKGDIADDLHIDHLCMNKRCCNPDHLEAVTQAENNRRARVALGYCIGGQCGRGHPLTIESTRQTKRGQLCCKACEVIHRRAAYVRADKAKALLGKPTVREIRMWAIANGLSAPRRGNLSAEIREAYALAHEMGVAA